MNIKDWIIKKQQERQVRKGEEKRLQSHFESTKLAAKEKAYEKQAQAKAEHEAKLKYDPLYAAKYKNTLLNARRGALGIKSVKGKKGKTKFKTIRYKTAPQRSPFMPASQQRPVFGEYQQQYQQQPQGFQQYSNMAPPKKKRPPMGNPGEEFARSIMDL